MTNNQLTSTHLAVKSELDGYKIHASRGQATALAMVRLFESIDKDLAELQERRKAAMDGEPVVFTDERNLHHIAMGRETSLIWGKQNSEAGDIPLYRHAQPALAMSEIDRQSIADKVYEKCCRIPGATFYNAAEFAIDEVEACQAAMLAATPQESK